jgi:type IV protein arginine methyltransferase
VTSNALVDDIMAEDQDAHPLDLDLDDEIDTLANLGLSLIYAILEGEDMQYVQRLLDAGAPVWYQDEVEGISALHAAAYTENKELIDLLIDQGALWNAGSPYSS